MVTNIGNVEGPNAYNFYAANTAPSVCNPIEKMAAERAAVAAAYGARAFDMKKWLADTHDLSVAQQRVRSTLYSAAATVVPMDSEAQAEQLDLRAYLHVLPGHFVEPAMAIITKRPRWTQRRTRHLR